MLNEVKNTISNNKDFFIILISLFSLLFSIISYFKNTKDRRYENNINNLELTLKNFYSPILVNYNLNISPLIDDKIKLFFLENSFLFDKNVQLLVNELIYLESNNKLSNKKFNKKYLKTKKYFIKICSLIYKDYSKLYKIEYFSFKNKYFFSHTYRFILFLLDLICILVLIVIIFYLIENIELLSIISIILTIALLWILYRYSILSSIKHYKSKKDILSYFPNRNFYFYNEFSNYDAVYERIFSKKKFLVYKGLPIIHPIKNRYSLNFFSIYKIYKKINY